ncbi:MAG: diguanylate cyclase [Nevskia sp.]|nr:diguanylate cyclase [Nevskia sp.]
MCPSADVTSRAAAASQHHQAAAKAGIELGRQSASAKKLEGQRFIRRIHLLRALGLGLGFVSIASVLYQNGAHPLVWAALVFNGLVWPHLAYFISRRSADYKRAEYRHLLIDSTLGGVWVALMQFCMLPSVLVITMLSMDKISIGGLRFLARTAVAQVLACLATAALYGFRFHPQASEFVVRASMPFLIFYPLAVAGATYQLANKVRRQNKLLAELNRIDPLTGLLNRGHWEEVVVNELRRHQRNGRPAALLMLDIDYFKPINDDHGHPVGDEVIRKVAAVIQRSVRDIDTAGRYGGDEFGIVLPDADAQQASAVAERVRSSVEQETFGLQGGLRCTVSIGLAGASQDMHSSRDWIAQADSALYRAKTLGRNRLASIPVRQLAG